MAKRSKPKQPAALTAAAFQGLDRLEDFQRANVGIFPSLPSLRWFYRRNRAELLNAGAVVTLCGRLYVNSDKFAAVALEIGKRASADNASAQ